MVIILQIRGRGALRNVSAALTSASPAELRRFASFVVSTGLPIKISETIVRLPFAAGIRSGIREQRRLQVAEFSGKLTIMNLASWEHRAHLRKSMRM
jgi:hypothetical protein